MWNVTEEPGDFVTCSERLYLDESKSRVVSEGDPEAAFLLCPEGGRIPRSEAERLGLLGQKEAVITEDKEAEISEDKGGVKWPAESKRTSKKPAKHK